jgi:proteasome activator subunit 4
MSSFLSLPVSSSFALDASAAQSPGGESWKVDYSADDNTSTRNKPRTFPYHSTLPYEVEDDARRNADLQNILKHLYITVQARDFSPGALHWTRELRAWLELKFDLTRATRKKLVHLYFELALARGIETSVSERFANMFTILLK